MDTLAICAKMCWLFLDACMGNPIAPLLVSATKGGRGSDATEVLLKIVLTYLYGLEIIVVHTLFLYVQVSHYTLLFHSYLQQRLSSR